MVASASWPIRASTAGIPSPTRPATRAAAPRPRSPSRSSKRPDPRIGTGRPDGPKLPTVTARYVAECTVPVRRAAMVHWWDELTFLHWRFEPDAVHRLLPRGLEVEPFDGSAWV